MMGDVDSEIASAYLVMDSQKDNIVLGTYDDSLQSRDHHGFMLQPSSWKVQLESSTPNYQGPFSQIKGY